MSSLEESSCGKHSCTICQTRSLWLLVRVLLFTLDHTNLHCFSIKLPTGAILESWDSKAVSTAALVILSCGISDRVFINFFFLSQITFLDNNQSKKHSTYLSTFGSFAFQLKNSKSKMFAQCQCLSYIPVICQQ